MCIYMYVYVSVYVYVCECAYVFAYGLLICVYVTGGIKVDQRIKTFNFYMGLWYVYTGNSGFPPPA